MLRSAIVAAGLAATGLTATGPTMAVAQTQMVDEFKFGVLAHDIAVFDSHVETGADVNFEMLFTPPDFLGGIGSPRPHLGGSLSTAGNTNTGYFGLTWGITLIQDLFGWGNSVFLNGSRVAHSRMASPTAPRPTARSSARRRCSVRASSSVIS